MEEGKGQGCLASSRQYGNALLGVRHQEEEDNLTENCPATGMFVAQLYNPGKLA